jgi:hypothetical protein
LTSAADVTVRRAAVRGAPPPSIVRSWPLVEHPGRSAIKIAGGALLAALVGASTSSALVAVLAALLLGIASWRLFVPVVYELGSLGITEQWLKRQRRIAWREIESYSIEIDGVFLWPRSRTPPWNLLTGLYLPFGREREAVLAHVAHNVGRSAPSGSSSISAQATPGIPAPNLDPIQPPPAGQTH